MAEIRSPTTGMSTYAHAPLSSEGENALMATDVEGLLALARALSSAVEHGDLASIAVEETRRITGAARTAVCELRDGPELHRVAQSSPVGRSAGGDATEVSLSAPEWDAVRTLAPIWIASRDDARARYECVSLDPPGAASRCEAWAFLPLIADGKPSGVLTLAFAHARPFEPRDRAWQTEIAAECANALTRGSLFTRERTRADASDVARAAMGERFRAAEHLVVERTHLYERERFARGRAESETFSARHAADELSRARSILTALAGAATEREVSVILTHQATDAFHALGFTVVRCASATELEVVRTAGFPADVVSAGTRLPIDGASPEGDVVRSGAPLWLDSRAEVVKRYPRLAELLLALGSAAWLGVPIFSKRKIAGALALTFRATRAFWGSDRVNLVSLAQACAAALERAGALDVERTARRRTERLERSANLVGRRRRELVASVEHDMRTPLQAIALNVKRLEASASDPGARCAFERMRASVDRMDTLLRDLAESPRPSSEGAQLDRQRVDLAILSRRVVDELADAGAGRNAAVESAGDATLRGDPHRLMQVISNLVANALRHARGGTNVLVRVGTAPDGVFVEVHNEGEPIAEEACSALRAALGHKGSGSSSDLACLGFGLRISREVVSAHAGTVSLESDATHGTTFRFVLPTEASTAPTASA
jgi:signal transduction histidine kinase